MTRRKVIIDTDPGVDDVLALLLALASPEIDVLAITTVHGNIDVVNTTRNALSLVNVLETASKQGVETQWTRRLFDGQTKTIIAAGAKTPVVLEGQLDAAYFHGKDGLGGVLGVYPQYLPTGDWQEFFPSLAAENPGRRDDYEKTRFPRLWASPRPATDEILTILDREEEDSVTIIALGPLTNLSLACTANYEAFSRVQEVVVMGGALTVPGNVTPKGEFNFLADPEAAAHVFSYTSPTPSSTWPSSPPSVNKRLNITLLPLDTTTTICLSHKTWTSPDVKDGTVKKWCNVFMNRTFQTMSGLYVDSSIEKVNLSMHDPACVWYILSHATGPPSSTSRKVETIETHGWTIKRNVDVRIECAGTWTRGACVIDERGRQRVAEALDDVEQVTAGSDTGTWLDPRQGNRITWAVKSPGSQAFADLFMTRVFDRA